ncbi:conserved hypothetical protein [Desulfosarcina cetonica]|uniref:hypothetical protein n=1 Tax=Desulfosarcina cetonica TaxID=90730 RepID=UPI0006D1E60F|nr:hypothetical protein [Desulfosarcina cetonica]VTR70712.1 conserved hypothetical protein [Desulfosarcina cetonica]
MPNSGNSDHLRTGYGDIWLGDLLASLAHTTVGTDSDRCRWAVELLTFTDRIQAEAATDEAEADEQRLSPMDDGVVKPADRRTISVPGPEDHLPADTTIPYAVVETRPATDPHGEPAWLEAAPALPDATEDQVMVRPPLAPLWHPRTARALISTAMATPQGEGAVDIQKILDQVARLRPLATLPHLTLSTLRFGVQLLVDRGAGTWPFYRDQELLRRQIEMVVGRDRVETLFFADLPLHGIGPGSRRTWRRRYTPPATGTPVVLLTDLGIAGRRALGVGASAETWSVFADRVRDAGCPLLALVPYGPTRWPASLEKCMTILSWDRSTTVSTIRKTVGYGLVARRVS